MKGAPAKPIRDVFWGFSSFLSNFMVPWILPYSEASSFGMSVFRSFSVEMGFDITGPLPSMKSSSAPRAWAVIRMSENRMAASISKRRMG